MRVRGLRWIDVAIHSTAHSPSVSPSAMTALRSPTTRHGRADRRHRTTYAAPVTSRPTRGCRTVIGMCRNITPLRGLEPPATPDEIEAAALQYVRKVGSVQGRTATNQEAI